MTPADYNDPAWEREHEHRRDGELDSEHTQGEICAEATYERMSIATSASLILEQAKAEDERRRTARLWAQDAKP